VISSLDFSLYKYIYTLQKAANSTTASLILARTQNQNNLSLY